MSAKMAVFGLIIIAVIVAALYYLYKSGTGLVASALSLGNKALNDNANATQADFVNLGNSDVNGDLTDAYTGLSTNPNVQNGGAQIADSLPSATGTNVAKPGLTAGVGTNWAVVASSPLLDTTPQGAQVTQKIVQNQESGATVLQTDVLAPQNTHVSFLTGQIANPSADYYTLMTQFFNKYGTYDFLNKLTPAESAEFSRAGAETL